MTQGRDYRYNLGSYSLKISTTSESAQTWFNRGLVWTYGFNHEEAVRCFEKAVHADPQTCMPYWG